MTIQPRKPLTPALSPSDGAREELSLVGDKSLNDDPSRRFRIVSFSPSEGEKAGMRGCLNCIDTAKPVEI